MSPQTGAKSIQVEEGSQALQGAGDNERIDVAPEGRVQELERLIEEKRKEEAEAQDRAAKRSAQLKKG